MKEIDKLYEDERKKCPICCGKERYKPEELCHTHWVMWAYLGDPRGLSGCYVRDRRG